MTTTTEQAHIAIVVGGATDLGPAIARALSAPRVTVILVDDPAAEFGEAAAGCEQAGATAIAVPIKLDDPVALSRLPDALPPFVDHCDVLVNAPFAVNSVSDGAEALADWERIIRINLTGPYVVVQGLLPLLRRATSASIVNVGSIDGVLGNPALPSYSAAKGGLVALTHVMAQTLGSSGIRVNYVARCGTQHPSPSAARAAFEARVGSVTPLGRLGMPEETAEVVRFLASPASSYVSGSVVTVDGGRTAATPATY